MALLTVTIILTITCLWYRKSKFACLVLVAWLWILYGWSSGTADFSIYQNRYDLYLSRMSYTEPLYTLIVRIFHFLGADFRTYLIVTSLFCFILMYKTANDFSPNKGLVFGLYAIFPFVMDVTIMRYFFAGAIIIYGFRFLIMYQE